MSVKVTFNKAKHVFKSFSELGNFIKQRQGLSEDDRKKESDARVSNDSINDMSRDAQIAYLDHAIKCLRANLSCSHRHEFAKLLEMRARGMKFDQIAQIFQVPSDVVEYMEREAMKWAIESIDAVVSQGIPIVGGKPYTIGNAKLSFT